MKVLGIDPGLSGGLVLLEGRSVLERHVMPTRKFKTSSGKWKTELDEQRLSEIVQACRYAGVDRVLLEQVHAMPGQGVTSMFSFGQSYGTIRGILQAHGLRYELVSPSVWTKAVVPRGEADSKARATKRALELLPPAVFLATKRSRVPHSGLIDAFLIARYGLGL